MTSTDTVLTTMLTAKFNVPEQDITPDSTLDELDIDSLALAELALALQDEFGIKIADHEANKDTTVAELAATLDAKRATTASL